MSNLEMVRRDCEVNKSCRYFLCSDVAILRRLGLASFLYMIIFAGLEFTITFLVYNRFNWNR